MIVIYIYFVNFKANCEVQLTYDKCTRSRYSTWKVLKDAHHAFMKPSPWSRMHWSPSNISQWETYSPHPVSHKPWGFPIWLLGKKHPNTMILRLLWEPGSIPCHPFGWFLPGTGTASSHLSWIEERDRWASLSVKLSSLQSCKVRTWLPCSPWHSSPDPLPSSTSLGPVSLLVEREDNCGSTSCDFPLSGITTLELPHVQCLQTSFYCIFFVSGKKTYPVPVTPF